MNKFITDTNFIPEAELEKIYGTKVLIINALRKEKHISHFSLNEALEVINKIKQSHSLLLIQGMLANGTAFEDTCAVSEHAINIVIGRGDTDLVIDSPAVSRQHARLNGTHRELTVSDLGSSNGTSINGIPCLEGEIMFLEQFYFNKWRR